MDDVGRLHISKCSIVATASDSVVTGNSISAYLAPCTCYDSKSIVRGGKENILLCNAMCKHPLPSTEVNVAALHKG